MVAAGERRNYHYHDPNSHRNVAALNFVQSQSAGKLHHGNNGDEQRVPQGYWQPKAELYQDNLPYDYPDFVTGYNPTYPLNHNVVAYPTFQPGTNDTKQGEGEKEQSTAPLFRQGSIPHGTASLEHYINNGDIDQVLDNWDLSHLTGYENEDFSVEDYIDLEKVNVCEQDGINFDVAIKQEKPDNDQTKNLEEMESMLNANLLNANVGWAQNMNNNYSPEMVGNNEQSLDELNKNLLDMFNTIYHSTNNGEWQPQYQGAPPTVAKQFVVKTEPSELLESNSDNVYKQGGENSAESSGIPVPDDELIEMPVSRFNEFLTTLTAEQCNLAKDIRRRGKNKKAARLCRKRKLDTISVLADDVTELEEKKCKLLEERRMIMSETEELKRRIDTICEVLLKGLTDDNTGSLPDVSVLHHSDGETLFVKK